MHGAMVGSGLKLASACHIRVADHSTFYALPKSSLGLFDRRQALLARGLDAERPVAILNENSLEHALLTLGCLYVGIPYCPVSPPYSTGSKDFEKLRHVMEALTPGLIFAADAQRYGRTVEAVASPDVEVVLVEGTIPRRRVTA